MTYYSKIDSAKILLEDSISNYFNDKITPSSFLLAGNARWLLSDLLEKQNKKSPWLEYVKQNHNWTNISEMIKNLKLHSNFFKHSDREHDEIKEILCEEWFLEFILWEAIWNYEELTSKLTLIMHTFRTYFIYKSYYLLNSKKEENNELYTLFEKMTSDHWKIVTKKEFYDIYLLNITQWIQ